MIYYRIAFYSYFGGRYFIDRYRPSSENFIEENWLFKDSDRFQSYPNNGVTIDISYKTAREAIAKLKSLGFKLSLPEKSSGYRGMPTYKYKDLSQI